MLSIFNNSNSMSCLIRPTMINYYVLMKHTMSYSKSNNQLNFMSEICAYVNSGLQVIVWILENLFWKEKKKSYLDEQYSEKITVFKYNLLLFFFWKNVVLPGVPTAIWHFLSFCLSGPIIVPPMNTWHRRPVIADPIEWITSSICTAISLVGARTKTCVPLLWRSRLSKAITLKTHVLPVPDLAWTIRSTK